MRWVVVVVRALSTMDKHLNIMKVHPICVTRAHDVHLIHNKMTLSVLHFGLIFFSGIFYFL